MHSARAGIRVQSVARAIDVLACFTDHAELGISELSDMLGLSKSTVYGMVNTLTAYSFLEQVSTNKRYRLGISLFEFGNLVHSRMDARREASVICQIMAQKYPATIHLAVPSNHEVIYIDKIDNRNAFVGYTQIGKRAPMYCTGVGKVLLAHMPSKYWDVYMSSVPLVKLTENTITDKRALRLELEKIRLEGVAVDRGEIEPGLEDEVDLEVVTQVLHKVDLHISRSVSYTPCCFEVPHGETHCLILSNAAFPCSLASMRVVSDNKQSFNSS